DHARNSGGDRKPALRPADLRRPANRAAASRRQQSDGEIPRRLPHRSSNRTQRQIHPPPMTPIIVALDVETAEEARSLVRRIGPKIDFYKVGMELYCAAGMDFVRELIAEGKQVFLDLKFYDIGETVKRAVAQVAKTPVSFLTIHGIGAVMRAAIQGRGNS